MIAHLLTHPSNCIFNNTSRCPELFTTGDFTDKALQHPATLQGMGDLWMELQAIEVTGIIRHTGIRAAVGPGHPGKALWQCCHLITVAHPHIKRGLTAFGDMILNAIQQSTGHIDIHTCITKLTQIRGGYLTTQLLRHGLHAIANTKHRNTQLKHTRRCTGRIRTRYRLRAARENNRLGRKFTNGHLVHIEGVNLTVNPDFTYPTGYQLGVL